LNVSWDYHLLNEFYEYNLKMHNEQSWSFETTVLRSVGNFGADGNGIVLYGK
jgi:hypothetical protein